MERSTIEATDENVIKSLETPSFDRSSDIEFFIQTLDQIKGKNFFCPASRNDSKISYIQKMGRINNARIGTGTYI